MVHNHPQKAPGCFLGIYVIMGHCGRAVYVDYLQVKCVTDEAIFSWVREGMTNWVRQWKFSPSFLKVGGRLIKIWLLQAFWKQSLLPCFFTRLWHWLFQHNPRIIYPAGAPRHPGTLHFIWKSRPHFSDILSSHSHSHFIAMFRRKLKKTTTKMAKQSTHNPTVILLLS